MPLSLLCVIKVNDELIRPPGPKFVVCVEPTIPLFFRINSDGWRDGSVAITCSDHAFLHHDSHIECDALDFDDYIVNDGLAGGIKGHIHSKHIQDICEMIMRVPKVARRDRIAICKALGCPH